VSKRQKILVFLSVAGAFAAASLTPTYAAPPVKDQGRVLIRVEGHQESYGILASPQHSVTDYALSVTVAGEGALSVSSRRLNTDNGETLDDPPRATETRFRIAARDLARLKTLLAAGQIGQQQDCHSYVQFFGAPSASEPPRQRIISFAPGQRHELEAWHGAECGAEVVSLLRFLAGLAEAVYELPQER